VTLAIGVTVTGLDADTVDFVRQAERIGASTVWVPEFWMYDALTPVAYLAATTETIALGTAIAQLGTRTPAMLAMSAMSLQALSSGRFLLGIGTSGPQVMEGWHGVRFDRPVARTRETIEIVRIITSGARLDYAGEIYTLPLPDGEGRSLRSPAGVVRVPIYVAALGPANLRLNRWRLLRPHP
jgi:alkanesulfonate monooxygenase SsuD/methylene tetrahydromethanopterin reductase-like flavin-dependent oxidoreductase (luciferase family)